MAWNEPDDKDRDPWGGRRNNQGPPDLDEVVKKMQEKLGGLFGGGRQRSAHNRPENSPFVWMLAAIALIAWLSYDMFYRIEPAQRGVVKRFGEYVAILEPGPHFRFPRPIEEVIKVDVERIQVFPVDATMLTGDENILDIEVATQYRINDAVKYLFNTSDPDDTVRQLTESSIREIIGTNKFDFVITEGRGEIALRARERMQEILDVYDTGIEVTSVNMQPAKPPEQVKAAFDDAIKAREDEQRKINEAEAYRNEVVERAQGEADRIRLESQGYRERVVARAEGEARRFEQLLSEYEKAPEVTRKRLYIEAIEAVLSDTSKVMLDADQANSLMYLPLDRMIGPSGSGARASQPLNSQGSTTITTQSLGRRSTETRTRETR